MSVGSCSQGSKASPAFSSTLLVEEHAACYEGTVRDVWQSASQHSVVQCFFEHLGLTLIITSNWELISHQIQFQLSQLSTEKP